MEIALIITSIGCAIGAIGSFVATLYVIRKNKANDRKAIIRAKGYEAGQFKWKVKVWNDGISTARNIKMSSLCIDKDGIEVLEEGRFPYPILNAGDSFNMHAVLGEFRNYTPVIKLTWDDDYSKNNEREQVLEF